MNFIQELRQQRWDDHRFYHQNRINQFLHLLSALCFLTSYVMIFINPVIAVFTGWLLAMVLRQTGHFFFESLDYDEVNEASNEHKESIKVGYNLQRKVVLLSVWILAPVALYFNPTLSGLMKGYQNMEEFIYYVALIWLFIAVAALLLRMIYLFFSMSVQSGLVWFSKILTDPFHDVLIYYKSPYHLLKREMYDDMSDWYDSSLKTGRVS